jgi:tRNA pseudouridine55 synthase
VPNGVLLLDKPRGLSSNAALQRVRSLYGRAKAGHVGSLDPLATGMLPICLGEATKVAGEILAGRKCYRFTIALGRATASGDAEGAVTATAPVPPLEAAACAAVLARFLGVQEQVPPMYSALKHGGAPLYRLARAGVSVPRAPRRIEITSLALAALEPGELTLETLCSKGTYVRVLAEDVAVALGTVGHVSALRRLYVEPFAGQKMWTLTELDGGPAGALLPSDWALRELPLIELDAEGTRRIGLGQQLPSTLTGPLRCVRLYGPAGRFLGLGSVDEAQQLQPRRLFN